MKRVMMALAILGLAMGTAPVVAGPAVDALSECMADNSSGRDRKDLARWVFVAMSAHPEMRDIAGSLDSARESTNQTMGKLVTRLLAESCPEQTRAAMQQEGSVALQISFGVLGQLAMQELMSSQAVSASVGGFEKYIDKEKVEPILSRQ